MLERINDSLLRLFSRVSKLPWWAGFLLVPAFFVVFVLVAMTALALRVVLPIELPGRFVVAGVAWLCLLYVVWKIRRSDSRYKQPGEKGPNINLHG